MKKRFTKFLAALALLVFMMPSLAGWGQTKATVTDQMTHANLAATGSSYTNFSGVSLESDAVYAGNSARENTNSQYNIQLRSNNNNSGIVTTTSGGTITSITITVAHGTNTVEVYGKNTAYSAATDLYNTNTQGTKIGSLSATGTINVTDSYAYVGIRSKSGAIYLSSIDFVWEEDNGSAVATTTTIDASNITNTDVYVSTAAGSLTASVTETESGNAISNATVTWSSSDTDVAAIDNNGIVTLAAVGTTTITASYAGESGVYGLSFATYELTVTSSEPYVQPTEIEITPNYTFWGKTGLFSGSTYDELTGSKDNVSLVWTRGSGSTYASSTAMRFYKDNTLVFTAPTGYEITSIVITFTDTQNDLSFSPEGYSLSGTTGTWTGSSETVTMSRPSNASSYAQISKFAITLALPKVLSSIALSGDYPTTFHVGDAFSHEGMTVTATYDDESTKDVTADATFSGYDMSTSGNQSVTVSYTENEVTKTAEYTITVNALPTYTVTLGDDNSIITQASAGASVTLPSRGTIGDYTFAGWSETNVSSETTNAPTIIPAGSYTPTSNITLYPVYTKTVASSTPQEVTASVSISDYATANSWESGNKYYVVNVDSNVNVTTNEKGTTGQYNSNGNYWGMYQTSQNASEMKVNATAGNTLNSVTFTYTSNNNGVLVYNSSKYSSGAAVSLTGNQSDTFTVGNTGSATNGQARITAISITYTASGGSTTYYWSSPVAAAVETPVITVAANPFLFSTTATITCATDGANIKYSYDGETWNDYSTALTITETKTIYAKGIKGSDESSVAQVTITKNLAEPTVTIDATSITNTNVYTGTAAGSLTASVTYNDEAIDGATVTWSGNNNEAATINASTGAVTLVAAGSVTFTATYAGNGDYSEKTATYEMTVTSSAPVVDYADLSTPFKYTGNGTGTLPSGLTVEGPTTYSSQPNIKFDSQGDYVILKTGTAPGSIVFDIAGRYNGGTWSGEFDLQISEDGSDYSNLAKFESLTDNTQTVFFTNTNSSVRYIKWVFTSKTSGYNVAIGNIIVTAEQSIANGTSTFTPEANHVYVVNSGATLVLDGDYSETLTNASNLIVEDGGELITHYAVQATVKKNVEKATTWSAEKSGGVDGWYFIASPVNGASYNTAITTGDDNDYDLFMLDWANKKWLNKKVAANSIAFGDGFTRGTGYLYASEAGNTISVAGVIQPLSNEDKATVTITKAGWNLIGNPLTCKVTVDCPFSQLNGGSAVTSGTENSTVINPFQGIAVYSTESNETITFTKAEAQNAAAPSNNNSLQMTLAKKVTSRGEVSTKVVDNAVVSFNNSKGMPKFNMLGGNAKLYIPQNNEEYAVVFSDRQGDMPLNFKADELGTYTINFETSDRTSLQGIYLIDMLEEQEIDLSVEPSYTFIGSPADREARFKIVFRTGFENSPNDIFAYQNGSDIVVCGEGELQIFDVMGRMVATQRISGVETINVKSQGVYIMKLNEKTQKIVVR